MLGSTDPRVEDVRADLLRRVPTWRKLQTVGEMNEKVRRIALGRLRHKYPDDSPQRLQRRLADLILGPELALRVYGPMPAEPGDVS